MLVPRSGRTSSGGVLAVMGLQRTTRSRVLRCARDTMAVPFASVAPPCSRGRTGGYAVARIRSTGN